MSEAPTMDMPGTARVDDSPSVRILVAEDEAPVRSLLGELLAELPDVEVELTEDGETAWRRLEEYRPDVLITDLRMPRLSGEELTSRALQLCPDMTVLIETGNPTIDGAVELLRGGAYDFITKPFDLVDLQTAIGRAVEEARGRLRGRSADVVVSSLMAALEARDPYLRGHSRRVSVFARLLGQDVGLRGEALQRLEWEALVHDLGKIGITDAILHKRGRLTDEEYEEMKLHAGYSADIIRPLADLRGGEASVRTVCHHHERVDGRGYPAGLSGAQIPLHSRIISVCDTYDAMTSDRPYRTAVADETARARLREAAGTQLDGELVEVFLANLDRYKDHVYR